MSLVSYEVDSSGSEEEGEGSRASGASKTGKTQDVRELLSVLPNRDKKQPVRLSVPVLSRGQKVSTLEITIMLWLFIVNRVILILKMMFLPQQSAL